MMTAKATMMQHFINIAKA